MIQQTFKYTLCQIMYSSLFLNFQKDYKFPR